MCEFQKETVGRSNQGNGVAPGKRNQDSTFLQQENWLMLYSPLRCLINKCSLSVHGYVLNYSYVSTVIVKAERYIKYKFLNIRENKSSKSCSQDPQSKVTSTVITSTRPKETAYFRGNGSGEWRVETCQLQQ
jgi:hypothetical protein